MKIKQYQKYEDVPKKYKWDLEAILEGKSLDDLLKEYEELVNEQILNKDFKYETLEKYLESLKLANKVTKLEFRISNYISNNLNTNLVDAKWLAYEQKWELLNSELAKKLGSENNRFFKHIEKMKVWKEDSRLKNYKRFIEDNIENFKHKLSDEVEEYVIKTSIGNPSPYQIFSILSNSELDYGYVKISKGKKLKLTRANRVSLMKHSDGLVRKNTYLNHAKAYLKHKASLSSVLYQHFNELVTEAKVRKYDSTVQMLTSNDKMTNQSLLNLFDQVSKRKHILTKYRAYHKKFYEAKFKEKFNKWDSSRELVNVKSDYSVEEAKELVTKALLPFGKEYSEQITKAMNESWIDFMCVNSKRSGAYSIGGSYGLDKKYILMNFNGDLSSVETLAHELGHSLHSYYSDTRQPLELSQYPIFLAEIASIFNESMLFDYMLKHSDNDKLKFKILDTIISGFIGTVWRQIEWANYEYDLYKAIEEGKPANSWDSISKIYFENQKKYSTSKKQLKYNEIDQFGSIYVPHYYYGFYVYKYAIGQLSASYFYEKYKNEGQKYLQVYIDKFLSSGCSDYPLEILKSIGIDLNDDSFYQYGFNYLEGLVEEWIKLGNKLFMKKSKKTK
ncbi:oligoendopeptidase F [Mycoplasmopsis alligatoris]|uniref:Oligopeptidase F n=1 Tax=Mycoplasmopsis alligatoris A21JP2 TaxID=747682 RepID=D4XVC5_9BACT|nr:oligoendopeptidase F [Mycoplasmopsis alligatoris]EFF41656.1 oligoendopeptidase F [Mycoplasmopsis alligatoris A21JP2]